MEQNPNHYSFYIDGIRCLGCVGLIKKKLAGEKYVNDLEVNLEDKTLDFNSDSESSIELVKKQLKPLGFKIHPANSVAADIAQENQKKIALKHLAVAGAMAGNIMMFVIPIYAGLAGKLAQVFHWISFILFLPILFYSSKTFFVGAVASIKTRTIQIDLPIAIALTITSLFSVINLLLGNDHIYFDSTAAFVFLILSTRYLMDRSRSKILRPIETVELINQPFYRLHNQDGLKHARDLKKGDTIDLSEGQVLAFDGINLIENACFDTSFVDGESIPKVYAKNQKVYSGYKSAGLYNTIRVTENLKESRLHKYLTELNRTLLSTSNKITTADKLSTALILSVLILSIGTGLSGYFFGWEEMIMRAIAILVIACPCALAFAAPVTTAAFLKQAVRKGIFLRDAKILEDINKIKTVFIDKTGTLTHGQLELLETHPSVISTSDQAIILALEKPSKHPISYAFRSAWENIKDLPQIQKWEENFGRGVKGEFLGDTYELKALSETLSASGIVVGFYKNGTLKYRFHFGDEIRKEANLLVRTFKNKSIKVFLLSGDQRERVLNIAKQLEIPNEQTFSEIYPEDKAQIVSRYKSSMMIGDGLNDALAFSKADIGVSVQGGMEVALNAAQVFIAKSGLTPIIELLNLSQKYQKTMNRNLILALTYNIIGATLALTGFVNPLFAAVAMPISSLIILVSTWVGTK